MKYLNFFEAYTKYTPEYLYRGTSYDWLNQFITQKSLTYNFISLSLRKDSSFEFLSSVMIEFDKSIVDGFAEKQGLGEIEYSTDFFDDNPHICEYVTAYKNREEYLEQATNYGDYDSDDDAWESYIDSYEHEAEYILNHIEYVPGIITKVELYRKPPTKLLNKLEELNIETVKLYRN